MAVLTGRELKGLRADVDAFADQLDAVAAWLDQLTAPDLDLDSVLPGWRIADLVRHLVIAARGLPIAIGQPSGQLPVPMAELVRRYRSAADEIADRARSEPIGAPVDALRVAITALRALDGPWPTVVTTPRGPGRLREFVRTRVVDVVVHADDLARTFPGRQPPALTRKALGIALRTLTTILGEQSPGRSIEVRIPPYAAVQCGLPDNPGPTHTRGTPPNVVETDAITFLRLATGRLDWTDARDRIRASGERADLSTVLPVL